MAALLLAGAGWSSVVEAAEPYCENNPAVIYCNDFESGGLEGLDAGPAATVATVASGAPVYDGEFSLHADFTAPYSAQAEFGVRFAGVERVYLRFYMRFDASWDEPMHHFYAIHGDHPDDPWSCHGDAGCRPNGTLCLSGTTVDSRVVVDGEVPGEPFFYTYHPDMNCDPGESCANYADPQAICDGCAAKGLPCESGLECCWGNGFDLNQGTAVSMVQDTWYEVETMVAANAPGANDGEIALWIDGELVAQHSGIAWRETEELLLNHVILWNYFPAVQSARSVWFDNLVVSTEPVGSSDGDDGGSTGGGPGDDSGADDGGPNPPPPPDEGSGGNTSTGGSAGGMTGGTTGSETPSEASDEGGGCGCRSTPPGGGLGSGTLLGMLLGSRRRRRVLVPER
jgi:hypothetical protein